MFREGSARGVGNATHQHLQPMISNHRAAHAHYNGNPGIRSVEKPRNSKRIPRKKASRNPMMARTDILSTFLPRWTEQHYWSEFESRKASAWILVSSAVNAQPWTFMIWWCTVPHQYKFFRHGWQHRDRVCPTAQAEGRRKRSERHATSQGPRLCTLPFMVGSLSLFANEIFYRDFDRIWTPGVISYWARAATSCRASQSNNALRRCGW